MPRLAPSIFSSTIRTFWPLKNSCASEGLNSLSLSWRARPCVRSRTCGVDGNLKNPGGLASGGMAPQHRSRWSASRKLRSTMTSSKPSSVVGTSRSFCMLRTALRPPPYRMVGWSVRLATRSAHACSGWSRNTQTARRGLKARSRKAFRSVLLTLVRSRISRLHGSFAMRPTSVSNALRPESSSWQTRTQPPPEATSWSAKELFPDPGSPTSTTTAGCATFGLHARGAATSRGSAPPAASPPAPPPSGALCRCSAHSSGAPRCPS
mmetsp:Transcript_30777/g.81890  ORF Transcript_30777/g.81890 Transcript_30777/m.81890 type:complete len:265 (-) Transcript_30777:195-989(-)